MNQLNNGMPTVGLGFWKIDSQHAPAVVSDAIDAGYRHFDCACDYGNEAGVGEGLEAAIESGKVSRDDLWITSKLWNTYHAAEHVQPALEKTLQDLRLDYVDLYLIHFPIATRFVPFDVRYPPEWFFDPAAESPRMEPANVSIQETWQAMEQIRKKGLARNIGVSNFNCQLLREMLSWATIPPAVLQVELHPLLTQEKLLRFCNQHDIFVTGFSPLGGESYFSIGMADHGDRTLIVEKFGVQLIKSVLAPSEGHSFASDIIIDGSVQLQNVGGHATQAGSDFWPRTFANSTFVFCKSYIQRVVKRVLNGPVAANVLRQ